MAKTTTIHNGSVKILSIEDTIFVLSCKFFNRYASGITIGLLVPPTIAPKTAPITSPCPPKSMIPVNSRPIITKSVAIKLKQKPLIVSNKPRGAPLNN